MKTDGLFDPIYAQLERVLDLRVEQHGMFSANLANANTPNYRASQMDFSDVLAEIMESPSANLDMANTEGGHLGGLSGLNATPSVSVLEPPPWALDGNSVVPEQEQMKLMENNINFNAVSTVTAKKLALLKTLVSQS